MKIIMLRFLLFQYREHSTTNNYILCGGQKVQCETDVNQ